MKRRQLARDLREDVREQIRKLEVEVAELRGELRAMRAANANRLWRPETSATAAAASLVILSASRIVTRGIRTITGSPSSPFSVRVTSSLRQLTTLRMSEKPISLSSRTTCSTATAELVSCSSMCGSHVRYSSETLSPAKCGAFFAPSLGGHPCRAAQSAALYH